VLASTGVALGQLPDDVLSFYAALHALAGDHEQAIQLLAPQVNLEAPYLDPVKEAFAVHALAWAYLSAGESERARRLLLRIDQAFAEQEARGQLHLGNERAIWAMTTVLLGDTERALDLLEQAEQAGWRRAGAVLHDPRWAAVRDEPHFQAIVARVQADVAAQRARVEARDAEDEFEARLDAAVAAQQAQSGNSP
jgi:hypothetical protein